MFKTAFTTIKAFIAGVLAILVFHQGALAGLHYLGETPVAAYVMAPGWFPGLPVLLLWSLWGGIWGVVLWGMIRGMEAAGYYVAAILLAAILPSAVYFFAVLPLVGNTLVNALADQRDIHLIAGVLLLHAFWGLGVALFMRLFKPPV